jgi:hypothetical protein
LSTGSPVLDKVSDKVGDKGQVGLVH